MPYGNDWVHEANTYTLENSEVVAPKETTMHLYKESDTALKEKTTQDHGESERTTPDKALPTIRRLRVARFVFQTRRLY